MAHDESRPDTSRPRERCTGSISPSTGAPEFPACVARPEFSDDSVRETRPAEYAAWTGIGSHRPRSQPSSRQRSTASNRQPALPTQPSDCPASRLKKYTPGFSPQVTEVRTFSSGKPREAGNRGQPARPHSAHPKGHNAHPALAIERLQSKLWRNQGPQRFECDRPMRKQQVMPHLRHHPRSLRQRPRAVSQTIKGWMHAPNCRGTA
jgi:hypothetical protein